MFEEHTETQRWIDRGWYMVTEFEQTSSINFERTVTLAMKHPNYTPLMDERNILVYRNIYRPEDLLEFEQMYKLIKNWKGAKLYFKGCRIEFDMLGSGIRCYINTHLKPEEAETTSEGCRQFKELEADRMSAAQCGQESLAPKQAPRISICVPMGCIGCRRSHVSMEWEPGAMSNLPFWFAFGRLDENRVYQINKEDLTAAVVNELIEYRYCPLLDFETIRTFPQRLPASIDPRKDREWVYNHKAAQERMAQRVWGGMLKEPDVLPRSLEAYQAYLKRKNV